MPSASPAIHTSGDRVEVLGFWRKALANRFGEEVHVYLNHSLEEYGRLYINGIELRLTSTR